MKEGLHPIQSSHTHAHTYTRSHTHAHTHTHTHTHPLMPPGLSEGRQEGCRLQRHMNPQHLSVNRQEHGDAVCDLQRPKEVCVSVCVVWCDSSEHPLGASGGSHGEVIIELLRVSEVRGKQGALVCREDLSLPDTNTHTHTRTHADTHTHTHTWTNMQKQNTDTRTQTDTHMNTDTHRPKHISIHAVALKERQKAQPRWLFCAGLTDREWNRQSSFAGLGVNSL